MAEKVSLKAGLEETLGMCPCSNLP